MLFKLSLILLISVSVSFANPILRSELIFRPAQLIEVLADQVSSLKLTSDVSVSASESGYLNELAQALANHNGDASSFIDSYPQSKYAKSILTFGFKLRGSTKINTLFFNDSTEVVDHMPGFLDFRYLNSKLSLRAREIREMLKVGQCFLRYDYKPEHCRHTKSTGTLSVTSAHFNKNIEIKALRHILPVMKLYDEFLESQINRMDSNGNIPLGFEPATFQLNFKNFDLKLETTNTVSSPLQVNPNTAHLDLLELIDNHHRELVENYTLEDALQLSKTINAYGAGIALDSNGDLTIVYSFGSDGNQGGRKINLRSRLNDYEFVTSKGTKMYFNQFDYKNNTLAYTQRRANQLMIDAVNMDRLKSGLKPVRYAVPSLYQLAQDEAERMLSAGRLSSPSFNSLKKNSVIFATHVVGETTVKEFVYDVNDNVLGTVACFDNFSNQRAKLYKFFEFGGNFCSKVVTDNWKNFDSFGSGVAYNENGDVVSIVVMTESE